ncbi:MAG TPA: rod-binding protein [Desulfatiglandales bacterium]|nr:rod-binding protein [Desulfatiglandales bacterium]
MIKNISLSQDLTGLQGDREVKNNSLKKTCAEFEAIFIDLMLKSMRKTITEVGVLGESNEDKMFKSMLDENLAVGIAKAGGIGLGDMLFENLKR